LGEYPDLPSLNEKQHYAPHEIDFGLRLLGKFHITQPASFWDGVYLPIPDAALFPNERDRLYELTQQIKRELPPE
jgi:hypothetical protein